MVNIISPNVNNITSFKVHFSPKQEGTGDPSLENVREIVGWNSVEGYKCGKNMVHIVGYTTESIKDPYASRFLTNNYGTTINTIEPVNEIIITQSTWNDSKDKWHYSNGYLVIIDDNLVFGQRYKISFKVTNIINNPLNCSLSNIRVLTPKGNGFNTYIDGDYVYAIVQYLPNTSLPERHNIEIRNCGMSFTLSEFMVTAVDNEDYTYEPFQQGKNLFDYAHANILDTHIKNDNGVSVSDGGNSYCQTYIPVMPNTTYTLSGLSNEKAFAKRIYYYDKNKQWISRTNGSTKTSFTITTPSNCRYIQIQSERQEFQDWSTVQIELGDTVTEFEPYKYGTVLMDWTDTIGNIYGGYVDLVTGELVQTYHCYQITGQETFTNSGSNWVTAYVSPQGMQASLVKNGFCTHYPYSPYTKDAIGVMYNEHTITFDQRIGDATYWKNFCTEQYNNGTPITLVYEIKTPFTVTTLSPTQLSTLKGQNNFWSNADYVEIEYELTETFDIQKAKRKIILNQPHVESTSGTIAKPETDMIGKIKECKIHFMPVQQSDSDPAPDNIIPVTGWTGIDVYQAFVEYPITPIVNTTTDYGVKWVVDKDGLMTAYGTPTAFTGANLGMIDVNGDETLYGVVTGSLNNVTFNKPTLLDSNSHSINYSAGDGILITGLDLSLYNDVKRIRVSLKRSGNVFMSGSCNAIIWKDKKPTISTTTIDWTNVAGTMYGGYVDLISSELVQEFKQCKINELSWIYESNGKCFMSGKNTPNDILKDKSLLVSYIRSNYYTPIDGYGNAATYADKQDYSISLYAPSDQYRIAIKDSRFTDVSSFLSAMGDTYIWYRLAEPTVTYQLTPQQLTTLRGINNIWSSANGEVEIKYWKH